MHSLFVSSQTTTTNNQQPTTNNQQPTTNNQQPTTNNQQPTTNNNNNTGSDRCALPFFLTCLQRRAVVDVSVTMQLKFQQSSVEFFMVPQLQFIDRVVDILVARQRQVHSALTVQKAVEIAHVAVLDWLGHPLLFNDRCLV